jgi:hypothetical protein
MKVMKYTVFMTSILRSFQSKNRIRPARASTTPAGVSAGADQPAQRPSGVVARFGRNVPVGATANPDPLAKGTRHFVGGVVRKFNQRQLQALQFSEEQLRALVADEVERAIARLVPVESNALASARERGAAWTRAEYARPENVPLDQAALQTGMSSRLINERRNTWVYYALLPQGQTRGYRFPAWQFNADQTRLASVLGVMRDAGVSCWSLHDFMISPNSLLDGQAPRDWIVDSERDLERVLQLARARFASDQGAG